MKAADIAKEIRRVEGEIKHFKAELYDRIVALEHLHVVHEAAKAKDEPEE